MGYYFRFVVGQPGIDDCEKVVENFLKAGAQRWEYEDNSYPPGFHKYVRLSYPGLPPIYVSKKGPESDREEWAYLRLPWGTRPDRMRSLVLEILALANRAGFRLYDGQLKDYVTEENLDEVVEVFKQGSKYFDKAIGFTEKSRGNQTGEGKAASGRCSICEVRADINRDFICERCGNPEKIIFTCTKCHFRMDLTDQDPQEQKKWLGREVSPGTAIAAPWCVECTADVTERKGKATIYRVRSSKT